MFVSKSPDVAFPSDWYAQPINRDVLTIVPVLDNRTYSLEETPEAMRYLYEGRSKGKVVIKVI